MKPGIPWSIKGIESETREAAKAAAQRSGMTLGQWLNGMIQQGAEAKQETRNSEKKSAKKRKNRNKKDKRNTAKKTSKVDSRLSELADQLSALSEKGQATAVNRFVEYDNEPVAQRALEAMIERIERGEAQTSKSFQAINGRLDAIDGKLSGTEQDPEQEESGQFKALEAALRNIVDHIETSEKRNRDSLSNMQTRMSEMAQKTGHAQDSGVNQTAPAIAALDARVAELALKHEQATSSSQEETRSYLEERLAGIGEQIDAVRHSTDAMTKRVEVSAADIAKKETRQIEQKVADLIGQARTLMVQSAPAGDTLDTIRSEIESLNQRFDDIKAESASDQDVQSLRIAIEQLTSNVATGSDSQPMAAMEQRLAELTQRLDDKPVADLMVPQFAELEQRIVNLDQQLATALGQQGDASAFSALESQISSVAERMSATEEKLGTLTTIEQSISQLYTAIDENKTEARSLVEGAATGMPAAGGAGETGPSTELVALEQGLAAVRESSQVAEQHNQETLEAVHETLEQIITKLADMEARQGAAPAFGAETRQDANTAASNTDWQSVVQSHLQEGLVPSEDQPGEDQPGEDQSGMQPAFNPDTQINLTEPVFEQVPEAAQEVVQDAIQDTVIQDTVQNDVQDTPTEAASTPFDYIAQARLASQSAAPQKDSSGSKGAGFFTDKIMPGKNNDNEGGDPQAGKKTKSLFSLPFLTKKKTESDNDQPIIDSADDGAPKTSRKRLIMAGLILLIAAGAFAFSKVSGTTGGNPAPTASIEKSIQNKPVSQQAAPAQILIPEKSSLTTNQASAAKELIKQVSLTLPQTNPANGFVLAAPADPVTTTSLPPAVPAANANKSIQSPFNIQTATRSAPPPPPAQQDTMSGPNLLPQAIGTIELRQAAAKGDSSAQFVIATRYAEGKRITRNYAKAAIWYQKSASSGLPPAQYRLGTLFERGNGVPKDITAARLWYERAAENGNVKAMYNLAVIYAGSKAGKADFTKAKKWFAKASEHGLKDSQYNLAVIFERGLAGKPDQKEAFYWYSLAGARGDRDAGTKARELEKYLSATDIKASKNRLAVWKAKPILKLGNFIAIKDSKWRVGAKASRPQLPTPQLGAKPALTGKILVRQTQTLLTELGFDLGGVDGVMGSRTANAVRLFQLQNGLQVNGMVTNDLLQQLQART